MQIVSHMDSLDNHKVQKGIRREKATKNDQGKEFHDLSILCARKADIF